jgi:hypothetical protein
MKYADKEESDFKNEIRPAKIGKAEKPRLRPTSGMQIVSFFIRGAPRFLRPVLSETVFVL